MSKTLLFATSNQHKLEEIQWMLPTGFELKSLKDIGWHTELPEPYETFEENAAAKTSFLFEQTGLMCFSEDSGLMIDALGGKPGVYSARYSGSHGDSLKNIEKVLKEMEELKQRSARFISVIAYQTGRDEIQFFSGTVEGDISEAALGKGGFGYDPIFIPKGFDRTFSSLPMTLKNKISHRSKSMNQFMDFLKLH